MSEGRLQRPAEAWVTPRGAEEPAEEDEVCRDTARCGLCTRQPGMKDLTLLRADLGHGQSSTGSGHCSQASYSLAVSLLSPTCSEGQENSVVHP